MSFVSILLISVSAVFGGTLSSGGSWKVFSSDFIAGWMAVTKDYLWVSGTKIARINKHDKTYTIFSDIDGLQGLGSITMDGDGNIWGISTEQDTLLRVTYSWLVKFDGEKWKRVFKTEPDHLIFDGDHGLWWTTSKFHDLLRVDIRTNEIINPNYGIGDIACLFMYKNALWFNHGGKIYSVDRAYWTDRDTFVNNEIEHTAPFDISGMIYAAVSGDNVLWLGFHDQLARYDGTTWTLYTKDDGYPVSSGLYPQPIAMEGLAVDTKGIVWIQHTLSVSRFDGVSFETFYNLSGDPLNRGVGPIIADPENGVWVGTSKNIIYYEYDNSTGVQHSHDIPMEFTLRNCLPNPFNSFTTISFSLTSPGLATLTVYSLTGQKVRTLVSGSMSAGKHSVVWDGRDDTRRTLSTGVYLSCLDAGGKAAVGKMLLMK